MDHKHILLLGYMHTFSVLCTVEDSGWHPVTVKVVAQPFFSSHLSLATRDDLDKLTELISQKNKYAIPDLVISGPSVEVMTLQLRRGHNAVLDNNTIQHFCAVNPQEVFKDFNMDSCHFIGEITEYDQSFVSLDLCNGVRGQLEFSNFRATLDVIETQNSSIQIFLKYKKIFETLDKNLTCSTNAPKTGEIGRVKRQTIVSEQLWNSKYIVLFVVCDHSMYLQYDSSPKKCLKRVMEIITYSNYYFSQFNLFLSLTSMEIWSTRDRIPYNIVNKVVGSQIINSSSLAREFNSYRYENKWMHRGDAALLITGREIDHSVKAEVDGICSLAGGGIVISDKLAVTRHSATLLAHGIAHLLGVGHVSDDAECHCPASTSCIMQEQIGKFYYKHIFNGRHAF